MCPISFKVSSNSSSGSGGVHFSACSKNHYKTMFKTALSFKSRIQHLEIMTVQLFKFKLRNESSFVNFIKFGLRIGQCPFLENQASDWLTLRSEA